MTPSVKDLVAAIRKVESNPDIPFLPNTYITTGYECDLHQDIQDVIGLANETLITVEGRENRQVMRELKAVGILVVAGERDSFGWLTGVIKTIKGDIVYG